MDPCLPWCIGKYSDMKLWPSETTKYIQHANARLYKTSKIHSDINWWPSETVPVCPAILPKIIWRCQTENRGSKKCNMQYDGWCQFAKKCLCFQTKGFGEHRKVVMSFLSGLQNGLLFGPLKGPKGRSLWESTWGFYCSPFVGLKKRPKGVALGKIKDKRK